MKLQALRYFLTRMWDLQFVSGCGLYLVACFLHGNAQEVLAAPLAFNGGVFIAMWIDSFRIERLMDIGMQLARVCDEQRATITEQREMLNALKRKVDEIVGEG